MKHAWLPAACFFLLLTLPTNATTPAEFDAALASVQSEARALAYTTDSQSGAEQLRAIQPRLDALLAIRCITRPNGQSGLVQTGIIRSAIVRAEARRTPERRALGLNGVADQIAWIRASMAAPSSQNLARQAQSDKLAARAVLAEKTYASTPFPPSGWADKFSDWLNKLLKKLTPKSRTTPPSFDINPIYPRILAIAILAAVSIFLLVLVIRYFAGRAPRLMLDDANSEDMALLESRDAARLLELAEQRAAMGQLRHAFRYVYLATLVELDRDRILQFDRSKTNWEYLRALRRAGRGDIADALTPLTRTFDQVWYGDRPIDRATYVAALDQHNALKSAVALMVRPAKVAA